MIITPLFPMPEGLEITDITEIADVMRLILVFGETVFSLMSANGSQSATLSGEGRGTPWPIAHYFQHPMDWK